MKRIISAVIAIAFVLSIVPVMSFAETKDEQIIAIHYYGDANFNDYLNTLDATMILKICAELDDPTVEQMAVTYELIRKIDANKDGKVNTADASYVLQVVAGIKEANEYYETASGNPPTPTSAPTTAPTAEPTGMPTAAPTAAPTSQPTSTPVPTEAPGAFIKVECYDTFNEIEGKSCTMGVYEGENVITAENITLPEGTGYVVDDSSFSVTVTVTDGMPDISVIKVNVTPKAFDNDGNVYKMIYTITGFNKINNELDGNFALGQDIDLGGENRMPFGADWEDDTQEDKLFTGIFHGNNKIISGLCIDHTSIYNEETNDYDVFENIGLFALNAGTICNVIVFTQPFVGRNENYGVYGDSNVGVLAGQNGGIIKDSYVFGNVGALDFLDENHGGGGGICGMNFGVVTRCSFEGGAEGYYWIGGICGKNYGKISESYFAGDINAAADYNTILTYRVKCIGGICGGSEKGDVRNCYVYCASTIQGYNAVGGMIGWLSGGHFHDSFIVKSRVDYIVEDGGHDDVGALVSMPFYSGLYCYDGVVMNLPAEYNHTMWDMNGASHTTFPDLVNHRRFDRFYID